MLHVRNLSDKLVRADTASTSRYMFNDQESWIPAVLKHGCLLDRRLEAANERDESG